MTITQRSLTTGEVEGSGVFDELMRTVKSHVRNEMQDGKINGEAYAQVYLGAIQSAMQTALQFTLQSEVVNKQLAILEEQLLTAQKNNELLDSQIAQVDLANATAQFNLDYILPKQGVQLDNQNNLITKQTAVAEQQALQITAQIDLTGKQEDLVDEQILAAEAQHTDITTGILGAQLDKLKKEASILAQKVLTERAQTEGTAWTDSNPSGIGGLVGTEMLLKEKQRESFLRDAEQKAAKMYVDVFATLYATDPDDPYVFPENYGFDIQTSRNVMDKLLSGVGTTRSASNTVSSSTGIAVPKIDEVSIKYPREIDTSDDS